MPSVQPRRPRLRCRAGAARLAVGAALAAAALALPAAALAAPQYTITDLGVLAGGSSSQGYGVSPNGSTVVGRNFGSGVQATVWAADTGLLALPNLAGRNFAVANAANNHGVVVGNSTTTAFGSGALPVLWQDGVLTALTMPGGYDVGRANAVNAAGVAVGSVGGGIQERAVIYGETSTLITATLGNGSYFTTAYGINDAGWVVGNGVNPEVPSNNIALAYDSANGTLVGITPLAGHNGGLAFAVSNAGHVVGSSSFNQSSGQPYVWTLDGGSTAIPLPTGTSQGSARGVNSAGWVVGQASSAYSIPFLFDGQQTYRLGDLVDPASGWDFLTNTSSSALGISEQGHIIGTAVFNGQVRAYLLTPIPEPGTWALMLGGLLATAGFAARRRRDGSAH